MYYFGNQIILSIFLILVMCLNLQAIPIGKRTHLLTQGPGVAASSFAETFTAGGDDVSVIHYNPSLLMALDRSQISANHEILFDSARYNFVGWAQQLDNSAFAMSAIQLFRSNIEARQKIDDTPTQTFNNQIGINAGYAKTFETLNLNYGMALKYLKFNLSDKEDTAYGIDLGLSKRLFLRDKLPRRKVTIDSGFAIQNILQPTIKLNEDSEKFPVAIKLGLNNSISIFPRYDKKSDLLSYDTLSLATDLGYSDQSALYSFGLQYNLHNRLFFRGGWRDGITTGIGFNLYDFQIDYAYLPKEFATLHKFGFIYKFGDSKREGLSFTNEFQSIYSKAKRIYERNYRDAMTLQEQGNTALAVELLKKAVCVLPKENAPAKQLLNAYQESEIAAKINLFISSAQFYESQKDFLNAYQQYLLALGPNPYDKNVLALIQRSSLSKTDQEKIEKLRKEYLNAVVIKIDSLISRNNFTAAEREFHKIEILSPTDPETEPIRQRINDQKALYIHNILLTADRHYKDKKYDLPCQYYAEALRLDPANGKTKDQLKLSQDKFLHKRKFSLQQKLYADKLFYLSATAYATDDRVQAKEYFFQLKRFNPTHELLPELEETLYDDGIIDRRLP